MSGTPEPAGYWRQVGGDLGHELPGLLGANALFLAWGAPVILLLLLSQGELASLVAPLTLGPGLAGLATYTGRLARGEPARWWHDSLAGTGRRAGAGAGLVALGLLAALLPVTALRLAVARGVDPATAGLLTAQALAGAFLVVVCLHAASLVGLYDQRAGPALRNAVVLALRHPVAGAGLAALGLLLAHLAQFLGWGPLVVLPAVLALCAAHHTRRLVDLARSGEPFAPPTPPQETPCRPR